MVSSNVLTYEQGIRLMVELLFFFLFYFIYLRISGKQFFYTDLLVTTIFFDYGFSRLLLSLIWSWLFG